MATAMKAGSRVISGASSDRKISRSSTRMKTTDSSSSWLPVEPLFFCWSTWTVMTPARCTCRPGGGAARAMAVRRLPTRLVMPVWSPWLTSDSTCNCSAWPSPDRPRSLARTTVGTERRSCRRVFSHATSDAVSCPWLTAATTGTGTRLVVPKGLARSTACWLGALAGRKLALLPCVTLASDGRKRGTANVASTHTTRMTQRNLTANDPIAPKTPSIRTCRMILAVGCESAEPGVTPWLRRRGERARCGEPCRRARGSRTGISPNPGPARYPR